MRSRTLSALLGAAVVTAGLTALVATPAQAAALGDRLFLHGTSANYAQDAIMDPTAFEGYAPAGVTADAAPPTGTTSKTGLTFEPGGDPGLPMAPTFALGVTGSMTSACVDVFVEAEIPGESFGVFISFGAGSPADGSWVYPDPVSSPGTGIIRITTKITLPEAFTLPAEATVFFHINGFDPTPDQRPYTLYYDSVEHPSNVTLNPTGPCTAFAGGGAPAPAASSAAPSTPASAEPSASAAPPSESPSAAPSASASESPAGPNPSSCGGASDPSASGGASAEPSASGAASASASPSGGGGPPIPSIPPAPQAPRKIAADEPARDATSCRVKNVTLKTNATTVTAGNAPILSGVARDERGDAVEGATITIFTKGYGESKYTAAATVKTDSAGQYKISVRPLKQTSFGANVGAAKSSVIGIRVNTRINISAPAPGTVGPQQTFSGTMQPGYARVAVGLAYVVNGRFTVLKQANTDGAGRYAITAQLPRGTYPFVVFTSAHQGTDKGSRSVKLTVR